MVITTIQPPTDSVRRLAEVLPDGCHIVIVGDEPGPREYSVPRSDLFDLETQAQLGFQLGPLLPHRHYSRKNLGYLLAMRQGAQVVYETDDDNGPLESWQPRLESVAVRQVRGEGWINVYRCFTADRVWPRGFPLEHVQESLEAIPAYDSLLVRAPIQQGLAAGDPDVDAAWRLLLGGPVSFSGSSVAIPPYAWCPFNSQSTWWWPAAFALMYLPSFCSFRMTDIWRSLVAQRCLWELGLPLVFHAPEVRQERNAHDLLRDFRDEVPGYLGNGHLASALADTPLRSGDASVADNLLSCYRRLVMEGFLPEKELPLVEAWVADCAAVSVRRREPGPSVA